MKIYRYFRSKIHAARLLALLAASCATLTSWAQLDESKTYYITNVATGKVISNQGDGSNDNPLVVENKDEASYGQKWQVRATGAENGYIIVSASFTTSAIDVAPTNNYYPVHWKANLGSENQRFLIESVNAAANTYIIKWETDNGRTLNVESNGRLRFVYDGAQNEFVFEETTPQEKPLTDYWQDADVFEQNKLPAHATFMPYATTAKLQADTERYNKPWTDPTGAEWMSLNGVWNLKWTTLPATLPDKDDFWGDNVDASKWDTISVPSCLEMKGYGDPYYINEQTPFHDNYPLVNMGYGCENSVASYRRNFTLPENWQEKRVVLHFDGMYSAAYVWVNGQYIGYSEGSNTDAEFDLSQVVRQGENNVSVRLVRFSDGSYLEGQDMWRMSGIHRDVYLYATPKTYVSDHFITSKFGSVYTKGDMNIQVEMRNPSKEAVSKTVQVTLIDPEGNEVEKQSAAFHFAAGDSVLVTDVAFAGLSNLKNWTSETPNLYTVEISQTDEQGREEMAFGTKYGFRKVEIKNNKVYVNGQQVYFKGVNTQDTHPLYGRAIDVATMLRDVQMMKQANVNTVRGSHYPRQPKMYAMFDYYGLYCMDEADIECHYNWTYGGNTISSDVSAKGAFEDRMRRMVMRDRNYPSVVFWSLGNESGTGSNLKAAYDLSKQLDPDRIVHYEGATRGSADYTDLWSVMYPTLSNVKSQSNGNWKAQPYFMCEYAHAMGTAVGNLKEYWDVIESSTYGIGGCIWDFVDQSIYHADDIKAGTLTENGYPKYRSGVDFPNWNSQQNFVNNGLIPADRAWSAKLAQVKKVYQYVKFTNYNAKSKQVTLRNTYKFNKLENAKLAYAVLANGEEVETDTVEIAGGINVGAQKLVSIPYTTEFEAGKEYCLNLKVVLKEATPWAEAGYPIAEEQYVLQERPATLPAVEVPAEAKELEIINNATTYTIGNDKFYCRFNKKTGELTTWNYQEKQIVSQTANSMHLNNFRWVENDNAGGKETLGNGVQSQTMEGTPVIDENGVAHVTTIATGSQTNVKYEYSIYADGTVDVKTTYTPQSEYYEGTGKRIRRIGSKMELPASLEKVSYYARGPWDNYVDRADCALLGRYETTVTDMLEATPRPQTSGNRLDMRELTLSDAEGKFKLVMTAEGKVDFQLLHYNDEDMTQVWHRWDLAQAEGENVVLHLDYAQMGLGNASCGNVGTLSEYYVPAEGDLTHTIRFRPYTENDLTGIDNVCTPGKASLNLRVDNGILTLTGHIAAGSQVRVYDLGGSCVAAANAATATSQLSINLQAQPRGAYLVKAGGKTYKFIK